MLIMKCFTLRISFPTHYFQNRDANTSFYLYIKYTFKFNSHPVTSLPILAISTDISTNTDTDIILVSLILLTNY